MATGLHRVLEHLRQAGRGSTDGQLLARFVAARDEAAFAALVQRHGPMVLGVCRRVLRHEQDAEDAFQASFLVLARKAASVVKRESLGCWLYQVAYHTALEARAASTRRRARERPMKEVFHPEVPPAEVQDWRPLLDRELDRLPEKYRAAVVLCDLEGRSRREAARHLGVPEGTVSSRLTTARRLLARRLARYGLTVSGGVLAALLSEREASACVTRALASSTARAAALVTGSRALTAGAVPARVVSLTEGVVKTMLLTRLKTFGALTLVACASAGALGLNFQTGVAQVPPAPKAERPLADELEELRLEVAALRKGLQATRERVKVLEAEAQARKEKEAGPSRFRGAGQELEFRSPVSQKPGPTYFVEFIDSGTSVTTDPVAEAEAALKRLRHDPKDTHAADALEKALKRLKEERRKEKPDAGRKP